MKVHYRMSQTFRLLTACILLIPFITSKAETGTAANSTIDFKEIDWYAQRAHAAYEDEAQIRKAFPDTIHVNTVKDTDVQYFLEFDPVRKRQIITVRGTSNLANIKQDVEFHAEENKRLGIFVHRGFDRDAYKVYQDILPHLDRRYPVRITGHSLGAAISTLLMMYLHNDHFTIEPSVNFGQPKVTNLAGAEHYKQLPLLRVVDENDPVPLLPPDNWFDVKHAQYHHFGREIILLGGIYYVILDQHKSIHDQALTSIWKQLNDEQISDHRMVNYLKHISPKLAQARSVPFTQRERYIK